MKKMLLLLSLILSLNLLAEDGILLRFGAISDNHFDRKRPEMAERTRKAFELFKKNKVDFFVDCGDVVDTYQPDMFQLWRKIYLEVFADEKSRPDFLMIPAGHDRIGTTWKQGYSDFVKYTGSGSVNPVKQVKGYHFVSIAQKENPEILKKNLAVAYAASNGKPVFVITHYPPKNTTPGSFGTSGDQHYRNILEAYPQAISISGHTHASLYDERSIWQGRFTAVNAGSLAYHDVGGTANLATRHPSYEASIWDVYKDKIVIRRFNVKDGSEVAADLRWVIALPHRADHTPYSPENRKKAFPVPGFRKDDKGVYIGKKHTWNRWGTLQFPAPEHVNAASRYRLVLEKCGADGKFAHYGIVDFFSPAVAGKPVQFGFATGYLSVGKYRYTLTPFNCFGVSGKTLHGEFAVKKVPWKEVKTTQTGLSVFKGRTSKEKIAADANGFYDVKGDFRLVIPEDVIAQTVMKKKKLLVALKVECIGSGSSSALRNLDGKGSIATLSTVCYRATAQAQQYSFVFTRTHRALLIRGGAPGKYRFSDIKYYLY